MQTLTPKYANTHTYLYAADFAKMLSGVKITLCLGMEKQGEVRKSLRMNKSLAAFIPAASYSLFFGSLYVDAAQRVAFLQKEQKVCVLKVSNAESLTFLCSQTFLQYPPLAFCNLLPWPPPLASLFIKLFFFLLLYSLSYMFFTFVLAS